MMCVFCGGKTMLEKFDRKGRPYLVCGQGCGTRIFLRSGNMAGYQVAAGICETMGEKFFELVSSAASSRRQKLESARREVSERLQVPVDGVKG